MPCAKCFASIIACNFRLEQEMYMISLECLVIARELAKRKTSKVRVLIFILIFPEFSPLKIKSPVSKELPFSGKCDSDHVK